MSELNSIVGHPASVTGLLQVDTRVLYQKFTILSVVCNANRNERVFFFSITNTKTELKAGEGEHTGLHGGKASVKGLEWKLPEKERRVETFPE